MFHILFPYIDTAISNVEKLDILNKGKSPSASAPGTKIHTLIAKLKPHLIVR